MPADVTITITDDTATPALRALTRGLSPENLLPVLGRSAQNAIKANFDVLEATRPNKLGGPREHYYSTARNSTRLVVSGDTATVGIAEVGIGLRYYGGTIRAGAGTSSATGQPTKYLTIPATAEAYGKRASEFDALTVLWGKNGPYALAIVERGSLASTIRGGRPSADKVGQVMFWLRKEVDIPADSTMLPTPEAFQTEISQDFRRFVKAIWRTRDVPAPEEETS